MSLTLKHSTIAQNTFNLVVRTKKQNFMRQKNPDDGIHDIPRYDTQSLRITDVNKMISSWSMNIQFHATRTI